MAGAGGDPADANPGPGDTEGINERLAEVAAELASEAKLHEPSAAERARIPVAKPAAGRSGPLRRWRNRRTAAKLRKPVQSASGSRTAAGRPASRQPGRARSRPARSVLTVIILAFLLAVSFGLHGLLHRGGRPALSVTPSATASSPPATASSAPALPFADDAPFAGSTAASYADGKAGIILPAARAHGPFTAAQVASAFQTVKKLLVAADLNWKTLHGGKPMAFAALLIPRQRSWFYRHLTPSGRTRQGHTSTSRGWVTSFAPDTEFVGRVIKVNGLPMTASATYYQHRTVLRIRADYLFVYAVEQSGDPSSRIRVIARTEITGLFYPWDDPGGNLEPWVLDITDFDADAQCGATDGFVHPAFPQTGPGKVQPSSGPRVDPYDLHTQIKKGCQAITGT
jgi:hypothetical protein